MAEDLLAGVDAVITSAIHLDGGEMLARLLGGVPVVLACRGLRGEDHPRG
ncbi:MAG TPA: hypothetical protein VGI17_11885 [Solirubrobacterales bacterium]